jgi:demethylmenaquinone methyltransferase/2-methoxy-6-polyprenyl-1,4-benzoquinol methylase
MSTPPAAETWFGFRRVDAAEKPSLVRGVFDSVAARYDLMNDLMSGGVHRLWKDGMVGWLHPRGGGVHLDVAGGTGDIAFRIARAAPQKSVLVCDLTPAMLEVGRDRALDGKLAGDIARVQWVAGDAQALPLPDRSVASYTIAFGLRNVVDIDQALAEARRVLIPGGRFLCLEFSRVAVPGLDQLYDRFSFEVLPRLGDLVAGDRASYQYLVESIRRFPPQAELIQRMTAAGLQRCRYRNLSGGIAALHSGWRL